MAGTNRVLIVEDDDKLGRQIVQTLERIGLSARWVTRGDDAMVEPFDTFDRVILALRRPGAHGLDVLKAVRQRSHQVPVLVLSARIEPADKGRALEGGARDSLTKPFWPE